MRVNVELVPEVYEELVRYARREGKTISHVIRDLVCAWNAQKTSEELARCELRQRLGQPKVLNG